VKLYFRVLEGMLKAEQDRTGRSNFASLLASNSFHKCLAACAFEVVIASYRMVGLPGTKFSRVNPKQSTQTKSRCTFSLGCKGLPMASLQPPLSSALASRRRQSGAIAALQES